MAFYKTPCRFCGELIPGDSAFCPKCTRKNPFSESCPDCMREIGRDDMVCPSCGRKLYIACPVCGKQTFVSDKCDICSAELFRQCKNKKCGSMQFLDHEKCTLCGKKMK